MDSMQANDTLNQLRAGRLNGVRELNLSYCGLSEVPPAVFDLADSLEVLDLSGNHLRSLPDDIARLRELRILFCSANDFDHFPTVLGQCPQLRMIGFKSNRIVHVPDDAFPPTLRWLILTDNAIEHLPASLGQCHDLQKLMLAGNRLTSLPDTLAACGKLELLRIAANCLTALPAWLTTLPRLAWLAFAGNPFCEATETAVVARHPVKEIAWDSLSLQDRLGEGASGVIMRASRRSDADKPHALAVKLFKGKVMSDGLPRSEMQACIAAGDHPNLIAVEGRVSGHPDGVAALALSLIDPCLSNLGGPPSRDTCTRDVYPDNAAFSLDTVLNIAIGVASAVGHLHAGGILHGDLYAHNILASPQGDCLLGDFGAASFLPLTDSDQARALQRLDARAFGCLLEELLDRCTTEEDGIMAALRELQKECMDENAAARPLFSVIDSRLQALRPGSTRGRGLECEKPGI